MSRFAVVYEDPSYEREEDIMDWLDTQIDGEPNLQDIVDSWIRNTVAEKPQEEFGPFETVNS
jgi:hypothetical protein